MEIHAVLIGACPVGVKPGQIVRANGEVVDPLAQLYGRPAPKPTPAPKLEPVAEAASAAVGALRFGCAAGLLAGGGVLSIGGDSYPFGRASQLWRVRPDLMVDPSSGERMVVIWIDTPDGHALSVIGYDDEPRYTLRLGADFALTPPIAQQSSVTAHAMSSDAQARADAQKVARKNNTTECSIMACRLGPADTAAFLKAYDRAAAAGGDMTISGPGPSGTLSVRYSLKDFSDLRTRAQDCLPKVRTLIN
jgi:hypothetical protein